MDNVGYTPGTGAEIAADDVGGVLYQRVKIAVGNDGEAIDVSDARPLPVKADGAATEATLAALGEAIVTLNQAASAIKTAVDAINAKTISVNTGAVELGATSLAALESVSINNLPVTQAISASALPLPAGAATAAKQDNLLTGLASLLTELQLKPDVTDVIRVAGDDISYLERVALKAMSRLSFSMSGARVDCGGTSVTASLAANQTLAALSAASNVALGRLTADGQGIQMSQINYTNGFRAKLV